MQAAQGDKSELDFKLDICARGCGGARLPADAKMMEEDKDEKRKIQFSVPSSVPVQLDPRQVEMRSLGEKGVLKPKLVHMSTYQPPSLKAVQRMAQAHFSSLDMDKETSPADEEVQRDVKRQQMGAATVPDPYEESKAGKSNSEG
ncbi:protein phosphatase 1 regulatory subunit 1B isoform X2 [Oryzias latipes]|uniref:protein phosphatase 1 regulatory subunit 1B isoform X2 n=1 Tax=Oryzias latipes TaxID=8090 RepID=UPI0002A47F10|nr:protein phosphatase 1 regulatory subunit 1B isoform X2 [Oryzias latipes]